MLPPEVSLDAVLSGAGPPLAEAIALGTHGPPPQEAQVVAPVASQEVWAAGVTYARSRQARVEESLDASPYDRVYDADRPELFYKAPGWRVRGPGEPIGVRRDSSWNVPEPELALVVDARGTIVGMTIGDDVSSRSIEGENPLYLPQAKTYDGACALGPAIVAVDGAPQERTISMRIDRGGRPVFEGRTSTRGIVRSFDDLVWWLMRALELPSGAVLLTGTGIVPDDGVTLSPGDEVTIEIAGLGRLHNPVEAIGDGSA
jgi:2-dehydro-3-deoxy-D-arabinonate dehydratase